MQLEHVWWLHQKYFNGFGKEGNTFGDLDPISKIKYQDAYTTTRNRSCNQKCTCWKATLFFQSRVVINFIEAESMKYIQKILKWHQVFVYPIVTLYSMRLDSQ